MLEAWSQCGTVETLKWWDLVEDGYVIGGDALRRGPSWNPSPFSQELIVVKRMTLALDPPCFLFFHVSFPFPTLP